MRPSARLARRYFTSPRWWVGHVLVVAVTVTCLSLGNWQLDRSHDGGGAQSFGYALQWPLFAVLIPIAWWRILRLEQRRAEEASTGSAGVAEQPAEPVPVPVPPAETDHPRAEHDRPVSALQAAQARRALAHEGQFHQEDETDDELLAYNAYLARLAEFDAEHDR